jgi:hypothetical protein
MQGSPIWEKVVVAALSIVGTLITSVVVAYFRRARDKVELKARLTVDLGIEDRVLVVNVSCKGIRAAKIKGVSIAATFHKIEVQPVDGSHQKRKLDDPTISFALVPLAEPTNPHGFVLERDDICKFSFSSKNQFVHPMSRLPSENLRLYATLFDESTIPLASGLSLLQCMRSLANAVPEEPALQAPANPATMTEENE